MDALTRMILTPLGTRPGWWLPTDLHPPTVTVPVTGAATTGLAHGIAGPLALLAAAHQAGYTVPGQADAIRTAAQWLVTWQASDGTWPPYISGADLDTKDRIIGPTEGRTTAWCYGTPGIATALRGAGNAVGEAVFHRTAVEAMTALAARRPDGWDTEGAALCHGSVGILQAAHRFRHRSLAEHGVHTTLTHVPFSGPRGFLTGRAGTALALADHGGLLPGHAAEAWDCLVLLS